MKIDTYVDFDQLLLLNYKKLKLTDDEALVLLLTHSLVESGSKFVNPNDLALLCNFSTTKIDVVYSSLTQKGYIKTDILDDGTVITSFDNIINELLKIIINPSQQSTSNVIQEDIHETDLFKYMEKFFGRLLTPLEYDVIQSWKNKKFSFQVIKTACEIASQNGNKSIRYIDTIIFEENKKAELGVDEYSQRQQETIELSHVDWLNK